ncbi:aldo/keto reductase [Candidatus Uhrbacteria bacterium]|nr:aldo/keto reductase [Candidatus Uhrbacteria bacterium]
MDALRLVLGTVQLGTVYGIANTTGQPDRGTAREIIKAAWECGIRIFDTAQGYGQSEEVLGDALAHGGFLSQARVITKFHPSLDHTNKKELFHALDTSLQKLGVERLEGIFFHREESLDLFDRGLGDIVSDIAASEKTAKVGISVYSPARALEALEKDSIDCVQIPTNILDHRFAQAGVFDRAHEFGKDIFIRSIYLQGLLLLDPEKLSEKMNFAKTIIQEMIKLAKKYQISIRELAFAFVKQSFKSAYCVIGAETARQVRENCELWESAIISEEAIQGIRDAFAEVDERILNPAKW